MIRVVRHVVSLARSGVDGPPELFRSAAHQLNWAPCVTTGGQRVAEAEASKQRAVITFSAPLGK